MVGIWTNQNDMRLNSEKCKVMIIDFSRNYSLTSGIRSVTIGEQVLERVEHANMLGVTISNNLTWSRHVDNIVSKAGKRVYMFYQLKRAGISQFDLVTIFCAKHNAKTGWVVIFICNNVDVYINIHVVSCSMSCIMWLQHRPYTKYYAQCPAVNKLLYHIH